MEHSFDINVNGKETGITYTGSFLYRRPTLGARSRIDVMNKKLNGDLTTLDENTYLFNEAISYLRFTLIEVPDFWRDADMGMNLYDSNVVVEVYNKCIEFESKFLEKLHGKAKTESDEEFEESF